MFGGRALFESASIIPDLTPVSSGERSGNLSGNAQKTPQSRDKKKAEPLVFQRDSAMCEKFQKKFQIPEGFPESDLLLTPMHILLVVSVVFRT